MRILIADDDASSRDLLIHLLQQPEWELMVAQDGEQAWEALQAADPPQLAILDWEMPGVDGLELCRRIRQHSPAAHTYVLLVTARDGAEDVLTGLDAGANDYLAKPFNRRELRARVNVGARMVELQSSLEQRVRELEEALAEVKQLRGILPICSYCKNIRDDANYWQRLETYISRNSDAQFSHGVCPTCWDKVVAPQLAELGVPMTYEEATAKGQADL